MQNKVICNHDLSWSRKTTHKNWSIPFLAREITKRSKDVFIKVSKKRWWNFLSQCNHGASDSTYSLSRIKNISYHNHRYTSTTSTTLHYIGLYWEKPLIRTFAVTKLPSHYLLVAYRMFWMFVIHFKKTFETTECSFHWSRNLQCCKTASATLLVLNECAVGWITISVA